MLIFDPNYIHFKDISFNSKPFIENSAMFWDVENIGIKKFRAIKAKARFTPNKVFAVTNQKYTKSKVEMLQKEGIHFISGDGDSDKKIISIMRRCALKARVMIVTSDADFTDAVKKLLRKGIQVDWMLNSERSKRICMNMNLTDKNLKLIGI